MRQSVIALAETVTVAGTLTGPTVKVLDTLDHVTIALYVAATSGSATDTLDVYVDGVWAGVRINIAHFAQITGTTGPSTQVVTLNTSNTALGPTTVNPPAQLAAGQARNIGIPEQIIVWRTAAGSGSFTYQVVISGT